MSKRLLRLLSTLLCGVVSLWIGWAAAAEQKDAAPPTAGAPAPQYILSHSTVNNRLLEGGSSHDTQNTTSVIDLGGGNLVAAFTDSGSLLEGGRHFTGYAWSNNNGLSWTDQGTLPASTNGDGGRPALAYSKRHDTVLLATPAFSPGFPIILPLVPIQVFRSTDKGHSFGAPVNGAQSVSADNSEPGLAVDNFAGTGNGNVYLCWTQYRSGSVDIYLSRSTDGGLTFNSVTQITDNSGTGCFVAVSPNHQVNLFYYRGTGPNGFGGDNKIFMRRSLDRGLTFQPEVQVADLKTTTSNGDLGLAGGGRTNSFPQAAVNPVAARPYIYVVYNDITPAAPSIKSDIYYVRSLDGGTSWSAPVRVNDDLAGDQFHPTVAFVNAGEQIMFGFDSRSHDPSNLMFHRRGRLGVLNAAGNIGVLRPSFQLGPNTPIVKAQDPGVDAANIGDYNTIAGGAGQFSTVWSDNRLGNNIHPRQPDVRFARIVAPPPAAELAVGVAASPTSIGLGQNITVFTVTAAATGGIANDVFVSVPPVAGLVFSSVFTASGQCSNIDGFIGCALGPIAAGASKRVQIVATPVALAGVRTLIARATTSSSDANAANNAAFASVTVTAGTTMWSAHSSGNIAVPIRVAIGSVNGGVDVPISVPVEGNVVNIVARVRLNHTFDSDLILSLIAPTGQSVQLANQRGGFGDNYGAGANNCTGTPTSFYDFAATPIANGAPPFAGTFKPEQPLLNALAATPTDGVWKLRVSNLGTDTGVIGCFSLSILRVP